MTQLKQLGQSALARIGSLRGSLPLQEWLAILISQRRRFHNKQIYLLPTALIAAILSFAVSGAFSSERVDPIPVATPAAASLPVREEAPPAQDDAAYVHERLMPVTLSDGGATVLRFVQCRHYPKERMKLVQVGVTSTGQPALRFLPGDFCLFASSVQQQEAAAQPVSTIAPPRPKHAFMPEKPDARPDRINSVLSPFQQYACEKFGPACRIALAVQYAENPGGACEIYNYNTSNGSIDWGFFQINTVHLARRGLKLRDLLDCKANIDFAYQLFREEGFQPWTTYVSGTYRKFLAGFQPALAQARQQKVLAFGFIKAGLDWY